MRPNLKRFLVIGGIALLVALVATYCTFLSPLSETGLLPSANMGAEDNSATNDENDMTATDGDGNSFGNSVSDLDGNSFEPSSTTAKPGSATQWCAEIKDFASPSDCAKYATAIGRLDLGSAAFNPPTTMEVGDTVNVELAVSSDPNLSPVAMVPGDASTKVSFSAKVGRRMAASLTGDGFTVKALSSTEQDLFATNNVVWSWQVTALPSARHDLILSTYVNIPDATGAPKPIWAKTNSYVVTVSVGWWDRTRQFLGLATEGANLTTTLLKATAAMIIAAASVYAAIRAFQRKKRK